MAERAETKQEEIAELNPKFDCPKHLECDVTDGYMGEYDLDGVRSYASIENKEFKTSCGVYVTITLHVLARGHKITEEHKKHLWKAYRLYTLKIAEEFKALHIPVTCYGHFREDS